MYARDERTGFQSVKNVWNEMGLDGEGFWRDSVAHSQTTTAFNSFLLQENLMPACSAWGSSPSGSRPATGRSAC